MAQCVPLLSGLITFWFEIIILRRVMSGRNKSRFSRTVRSLMVFSAITVAFLVFLLMYNISIKELLVGSGEKDVSSAETTKQTGCSGRQFDYGIMFDAGSTGSRIHLFKFQCSPATGRHTLVGELFEAVKPGLSSYAESPDKGAESLRPLIEKACNYIPKEQWTETPIGLKATAGLRLLSNTTAHQLLYKVDQLFQSYSFKMAENSVSILEGTDEGLFLWFTVNFLHGFLDGPSFMNTIGVLDLGGGSTQVTFLSSTALSKSEKRIVSVEVFGKLYSLYSHSYLGLGLNSGRFQALGGKETSAGIMPGAFQSTCLPDNYKNIWEHGGKKHSLSFARSKENGTSRFDNCYSAVRKVIKSYEMDSMAELTSTAFYALSYYFDKAWDVKLIDSENGSRLTVNHYNEAAHQGLFCVNVFPLQFGGLSEIEGRSYVMIYKDPVYQSITACQYRLIFNITHECQRLTNEDAFRCLDLCYITSLLQDGFGLQRTSTLHLARKIRDVEIAWPLGAMFNVFGHFKRVAVSS